MTTTLTHSIVRPHLAARSAPADGAGWITATVRPAGSFGRDDAHRLHAVLDALSASASLVVLDLECASLRSDRAAAAVDDAAEQLERRGGCLVCVHADAESRGHLLASGPHAVLVDDALPEAERRGRYA